MVKTGTSDRTQPGNIQILIGQGYTSGNIQTLIGQGCSSGKSIMAVF